jgi:hypothetical protein
MSRTTGQIPLHIPRFAVMLLFCVGLAAQSVIDISGETHELVLHADVGDAYAHQHGHHDHHAPAEEGSGHDADDALHLLLHQPCGGHCVFMAAMQVSSVRLDVIPTGSPVDVTRRVPASDYTAPFRPPIRA